MKAAGIQDEARQPDQSSDDVQLTGSCSRTPRQELKQLDREIPWAEL